jgi:hypothetical protein
LGGLVYLVLYGFIVVATFRATKTQPTFPAGLGGTALVLSAAVGGYAARILGVPAPSGAAPVTPNQAVRAIIWIVIVAYVVIGVISFLADANHNFDEAVVPAVVAAQWKLLLGLVAAVFTSVLADAT